MVFGITTFEGLGGSFLITGFTFGLIDTNDLGSTVPGFLTRLLQPELRVLHCFNSGFAGVLRQVMHAFGTALLLALPQVLQLLLAGFFATGFGRALSGRQFFRCRFFQVFFAAGFLAAAFFLGGFGSLFWGLFFLNCHNLPFF